MSDQKLKIGIVGLGHVADHQLAALQRMPESYEIAAVCDRNPLQRSKVCGKEFFVDLSEMLDRKKIDVLLISVPNHEHFEVARTAIERGISVLIEKPATETIEQFNQLIYMAENNGILLHTAFHAAFARDLLWFLEKRQHLEPALGPITGIRCCFYDPYLQGDGDLSIAAQSLGGSWIDSGINALSVVDRILPIFEIEEARLTKTQYPNCKQIQGSVDFTFPVNGCEKCGQGLIDTNWTLGLNRKTTELFFSQSGHRLKLDHSKQTLTLMHSQKIEKLADFSNDLERLTAHYLGVFTDFLGAWAKFSDNRQTSLRLLRKLYFSDRENTSPA